MKKILLLLLSLTVLFVFAACGADQTKSPEIPQPQNITIKESPDKYTWYVKSYVGRNLASFGSISQNGNRIDTYGKGFLKLIFISSDGTYIDPNDSNTLRSYVVTGQSIDPNTELKLTFDSFYTDVVDTQNFYEIELFVTKLATAETILPSVAPTPEPTPTPTPIPTPTSGNHPDESSGEMNTFGFFQYVVLDENSLEITKYIGLENTVVIPFRLNGKNVTRIGKGAFENCTTIETIDISADIEVIGDSAFKGCISLKKISLPFNTKTIGKSAFEDCSNLEDVALLATNAIGESAFKGCTSLKEIFIPYETKTIGKSAFENCSNLETVTLFETESIEESTFKNCTSLKEIFIPYETKIIGMSAFENCTSLETVIFLAVETIGESAFKNCTSLEEITIPHDTQSIGSYAFYGCTSLETAYVWNSSAELGTDVFGNCPNLDK